MENSLPCIFILSLHFHLFALFFRVKQEIKGRAQDSSEHTRTIIQASTSAIDTEYAVALPSYRSRVRVIERQRNGETLNPCNIKEVAIPVELQVTEKNDQFLAYESGPDEEDRVLIFATQTNLDILGTSQDWHTDRTFNVSPNFSIRYTPCMLFTMNTQCP